MVPVARRGGEAADGGMAGAHAARHADHVSSRGHGVVGEGLEGERVVEREPVGGHGRAAAGVEHGRTRCRVGQVRLWACSGTVCGGEDATSGLQRVNRNEYNSCQHTQVKRRRGSTHVDHPVGDLGHAQARGVA